jgi:hypothetical protein
MNREEIFIKIIVNNSQIDKARLLVMDYGNNVQFDFCYNEITLSEKDEHPFTALERIRLKLEAVDIKLICQGSRIDVYPSGMQLAGFYAYELELSKPATSSVYILDNTEWINRISTVKQQEDFYDKWLESVGFGIEK